MSQSLEAYLILAVLLFGIGAFGFLAKRNAIAMLMSAPMLRAISTAASARDASNSAARSASDGSAWAAASAVAS